MLIKNPPGVALSGIRLIVVRHGQSTVNAHADENDGDVSFSGQPNQLSPLTSLGHDQIKQTARYLRATEKNIGLYCCSTFARTKESLLIAYPDAEYRIFPELDEFWRGIWYTLSPAEREEQYPNEDERKRLEGEYEYRAPGGENGADIRKRIQQFLDYLYAHHADETIIAFGHGNWMLHLRMLVTGQSIEDFTSQSNPKYHNGAIAYYAQDENGNLQLGVDNFVPA